MATTIKLGPNVTQSAGAIIANATAMNDGMMTAEMVQTLDASLNASSIQARWVEAAQTKNTHIGSNRCLMTSGEVFVVSGGNAFESGLNSKTEKYNPATDNWVTLADFPGDKRLIAGCIALANGKILVAGGRTTNNSQNIITAFSDCWLYDPGTDSWAPTGALPFFGFTSSMVLLNNGKVLWIGGVTSGVATFLNVNVAASAQCALYDPGLGTWALTGSLNTGRFPDFCAALLASGDVIVVGGRSIVPSRMDTALNTVEVYSVGGGTWTATTMPACPGETNELVAGARTQCTATVLPGSDYVLITGGAYVNNAIPPQLIQRQSSLLFDPSGPSFVATRGPSGTDQAVNMNCARGSHGAVLLPNNTVLVACGKDNNNWDQASCEVYDPVTDTFAFTASVPIQRVEKDGVATSDFQSFALNTCIQPIGANVFLYPFATKSGTGNKMCFTYFTSAPFNAVTNAANAAKIPATY